MQNFFSFRDSELTDYDISDFHGNELAFDNGTAPAVDVHYVVPKHDKVSPNGDAVAPARITAANRNTTGDSDDFVKVQEPIYDTPPPPYVEKAMSPEEAKQLQELYQEYDFGIDLVPDNSQFPSSSINQSTNQTSLRSTVVSPQGETQNVHNVQIKLVPLSQKELLQSDGAPAGNKPTTPTFHIKDFGHEDPKNIVNAEMFVADAIEYLGNQQCLSPSGAFVMEEDMLSSQTSQKQPRPKGQLPSGDPTSHQVKTMEVFERVEHDEHDDITYAPEIQSLEIPPDQMSENSDNLQEYFDRASAEGLLDAKMRELKSLSAENAPHGQAPHIMSLSGHRGSSNSSIASGRIGRNGGDGYPILRKQSSLLSVMGVTSMQEMLLSIDSLDTLSQAMRKAGLERTNMIFGIDYTASNKYQGEDSFGGRSLHMIHPNIKNPYQQVITILGRTLAPFASTGRIPVYGFGDAKTGDWSVFSLKHDGHCTTLDEVLKVYNEVTPTVDLSGPTNFAPLIYQAMEICQQSDDYHILVIIADGQVT
ncbi:hypothetical protein KIN20_016373 [Parelaphostrongylus tenuis]|uniref:Copine C-terminal domain-containing protein n=1 Tax=Parelaphostrongylus tenuis TaxID=148309 RepID=A0AAD5N1B1_PARTN|nr:hypothetical protein KIN20_016373 [Parelaphostrongylus tenuis]